MIKVIFAIKVAKTESGQIQMDFPNTKPEKVGMCSTVWFRATE